MHSDFSRAYFASNTDTDMVGSVQPMHPDSKSVVEDRIKEGMRDARYFMV